MSALTVNLVVEQNSDFEAIFTVTDEDTGMPINLSNYTAESKFRKSFYSSSFTEFIATIIDPIAGKVKLSLPNSTSCLIRGGRYVYDLLITNISSGAKTRVVEGIVTVKEGVT